MMHFHKIFFCPIVALKYLSKTFPLSFAFHSAFGAKNNNHSGFEKSLTVTCYTSAVAPVHRAQPGASHGLHM